MAADVPVTHRPPPSPEAGAELDADESAADRRAPEEQLPPLDAEEIRKRLEHTERQFRNRRKIRIRGLPGDVTNQVASERERPPRQCACAGPGAPRGPGSALQRGACAKGRGPDPRGGSPAN